MLDNFRLPKELIGLNEEQIRSARQIFGSNVQNTSSAPTWWTLLIRILREPMLILLLGVAVIYLLLGQYPDAYFMLFAIVIVSGISFYQDHRSQTSLKALEALSAPLSQVIRQGSVHLIPTAEIVPGDLVMNEEGSTLQADGDIVYSHDFSINESSLTGESLPVYKSEFTADKKLYQGTSVSSGLVVFKVTTIGGKTKLGQLGSSLLAIQEERSPLQIQINRFVRGMTLAGILVFLLLWGVHFYKTHLLLDSLLEGLTLAMSVLPEEIPVAFTTFMAIGAWKLMQRGIIIKRMQTVEALGSTTVLCADKTGTITENRMSFAGIYSWSDKSTSSDENHLSAAALDVLEASMWASEPIPFDPMEQTIHQLYARHVEIDRRPEFKLVHEYPLGGLPPMMTHIQANEAGHRLIVAKGAPEAIVNTCGLSASEIQQIQVALDALTHTGYRVLGVAQAKQLDEPYPDQQQKIHFSFLGLIAFFDPPKPDIREVFESFYRAGINVKIFTGDNARTTTSIARLAGIRNAEKSLDGAELMALGPDDFQRAIREHTLFTRMFPEAKLAAVESLKADRHVVAMVGDGVNDGPALKSAHIGIAMGKKGTELAKAAAAIVLVKDDLSALVDAIAAGRRIYTNLKKAIQYIISIHIPIILTVALPLLLGWVYPTIFTPIHVIFLELIMGPTCSIAYESEPMERNAMSFPPRKASKTFFHWHELIRSIIQGVVITTGILLIYQWQVYSGATEQEVRTGVFVTLICANMMLTLVNRSFYFSVLETLRYKNKLLLGILAGTVFTLLLILFIPFIRDFFRLSPIPISQISWCVLIAFCSVIWIEIPKWRKRTSRQDQQPAMA